MLSNFIDFTGPSSEACRVALRSRISTNHVQAARQMAVDGAGVIAALNVVVAQDLLAGSLVELLPEWQMASPSAFAVWPANAARGSLVLRFVDFLQDRVNQQMVEGSWGGEAIGKFRVHLCWL